MNDRERTTVVFDVRDGETREQAVERLRSDLRARGLSDKVGIPYVVDGDDLAAMGPVFVLPPRNIPWIGRRRPSWWPRSWR